MRIPIGSDANGYGLKEHVKAWLTEHGHEPVDLGCTGPDDGEDYPDVALRLARSVVAEDHDRAILICGTGIGMAITANKVPGVRAACAHDPYSAERARKSNNAQVLTLGAQIIGPQVVDVLLDHWMRSEFAGGRSARKVAKINALDAAHPPTESSPDESS
ncbi:RpiB/LacA/LacB family sugar-phosphate isomerase [Euzebya tangerina]|uniref:RpiB/LacA/LacB family sugar-phosphate isomerase n=1 Tax=Euzebya tangerina TaxID=591198 RepID=UPI000E30F404|nr:RpiB/LacA/LacB family sugar-phosphate isomerase [Euzebya tangerina]